MAARYKRRPGYKQYWLEGIDCAAVDSLSETLESTVAYLTDCRDPQVISKLGDFPVMRRLWIYHPSRNKILSESMIWFFPFGGPLYFAGVRAWKDLIEDCRSIASRCDMIIPLLEKESTSGKDIAADKESAPDMESLQKIEGSPDGDNTHEPEITHSDNDGE